MKSVTTFSHSCAKYPLMAIVNGCDVILLTTSNKEYIMTDILIQQTDTAPMGQEDRLSAVIGFIDKVLPSMVTRELVSTSEVSDMLLDMRSLAAADAAN